MNSKKNSKIIGIILWRDYIDDILSSTKIYFPIYLVYSYKSKTIIFKI